MSLQRDAGVDQRDGSTDRGVEARKEPGVDVRWERVSGLGAVLVFGEDGSVVIALKCEGN